MPVRKLLCAMMMLPVLLCGCQSAAEKAETAREPYQTMTACTMEAKIFWGQEEMEQAYTLHCEMTPEESAKIEVLSPELMAGVTAVVEGEEFSLSYEDVCLNAGTLTDENLAPATVLPRVMCTLRDGWLAEQSEEAWNDTDCLRLTLEDTSGEDGTLDTTIWLRQEDNLPLRAELTEEGEVICQVEFTEFTFCDTISQ